MKAKHFMKFLEMHLDPEDEILFCQDDGSGYTCEMVDKVTLTKNPNRNLYYWEREYGKKYNVIIGGS